MAERYEKKFAGINTQIPEVRKLTHRPFEQEYELAALKKEREKLEMEISARITENERQAQTQRDLEVATEEADDPLEFLPVQLKR
jgi:sensor histidine kinase YesM